MPKLKTLLLLSVWLLTSCGTPKSTTAPKEYHLQGEVISLDVALQTAKIKHGPIEGWMEAMTMEFPVRGPSQYEKLAVGKRISATVYVTEDSFWIANIQPASQ